MHFEYRNISIEGANNHRLPLPLPFIMLFFSCFIRSRVHSAMVEALIRLPSKAPRRGGRKNSLFYFPYRLSQISRHSRRSSATATLFTSYVRRTWKASLTAHHFVAVTSLDIILASTCLPEVCGACLFDRTFYESGHAAQGPHLMSTCFRGQRSPRRPYPSLIYHLFFPLFLFLRSLADLLALASV